MAQGPQGAQGSVMTRGVGWGLKREGIYVYTELIHAVV